MTCCWGVEFYDLYCVYRKFVALFRLSDSKHLWDSLFGFSVFHCLGILCHSFCHLVRLGSSTRRCLASSNRSSSFGRTYTETYNAHLMFAVSFSSSTSFDRVESVRLATNTDVVLFGQFFRLRGFLAPSVHLDSSLRPSTLVPFVPTEYEGHFSYVMWINTNDSFDVATYHHTHLLWSLLLLFTSGLPLSVLLRIFSKFAWHVFLHFPFLSIPYTTLSNILAMNRIPH